MKKAIGMFLLMVWAMVSLTACTGSKQADVRRVKCPACGYEFDASINQM